MVFPWATFDADDPGKIRITNPPDFLSRVSNNDWKALTPLKRFDIEINEGYFDNNPNFNLVHPQDLQAFLVQLNGKETDHACAKCVAGERRPFARCMVLNKTGGGSCGNCIFIHKGSLCPLNHLDTSVETLTARQPGPPPRVGRRAGTRSSKTPLTDTRLLPPQRRANKSRLCRKASRVPEAVVRAAEEFLRLEEESSTLATPASLHNEGEPHEPEPPISPSERRVNQPRSCRKSPRAPEAVMKATEDLVEQEEDEDYVPASPVSLLDEAHSPPSAPPESPPHDESRRVSVSPSPSSAPDHKTPPAPALLDTSLKPATPQPLNTEELYINPWA